MTPQCLDTKNVCFGATANLQNLVLSNTFAMQPRCFASLNMTPLPRHSTQKDRLHSHY